MNEESQDAIQLFSFNEINFDDTFFNSLRGDYPEFMNWVARKKDQGENAYVLIGESCQIDGFLYLKEEYDVNSDITPLLPSERHIKIGTFKVNAHNTVLGQRFLSLAFRKMLVTESRYIYATMFDKQSGLRDLFLKFGFVEWGNNRRNEMVLYKDWSETGDIYHDFPLVHCRQNHKYLLSIYPAYHFPMFPDSKLYTERNQGSRDLPVTNTIEKIYMCKMAGVKSLQAGDIVIIYRTSNSAGCAEYNSVATSICIVAEIRHIDNFSSFEEYFEYCQKGSVFSQEELSDYYRLKNYPYIIKMLYNAPFQKRVIRKELINQAGLSRNAYWGCLPLTDDQFFKIIKLGKVNESIIIN